ncbi:hypothetical protein [Rheinheimera texasensis]|uniref:hypothetical protein n=1 Tax=Rheinheimera texasensis TaxID=306205 RepID=UPI0004E19CBC|nr:hypothetical protein [Rheinheimera texasensis]
MKIVKRLLKQGENKNSIFEKASAEGLNPKKVSKYLSMYPDAEESENYNRANNILIALYSVLVLLGVLGASPFLSGLPVGAMFAVLAFALLIPGAVIYYIYKKQSMGYLVLCFFLLKGILDSFKEYEADPMAVWVGVIINACLIVYVVILKNKLFPYQNFFNTKKDVEGFSIFTKDLMSQSSRTP